MIDATFPLGYFGFPGPAKLIVILTPIAAILAVIVTIKRFHKPKLPPDQWGKK